MSTLPRTWLALILIGLLAVAPWLHGHTGSSSASGFHIDGLRVTAQVDAPAAQATEPAGEESLAVNVSPSMPHDGISLPIVLACFFTLVFLLRACARQVLPKAERRAADHALYALGWPPPSLAPPRI